MKTNNPEEIYDLSTISRDDLRSLLITAKDEWKRFTDCEDDIEKCKKLIVEEDKKKTGIEIGNVILIVTSVIILPFMFFITFFNPNNTTPHITSLAFICLLLVFAFYYVKRKKRYSQSNIEQYNTQLSELQKRGEAAMSKFDKVWLIPDDYCSEYAMATMIKFIDSNKAHSWKEVTTLYDEHLYRMKMEENTRLAAEEAIKQTEIARQTRNAARTGALGSWVAAGGVLRINSKL